MYFFIDFDIYISHLNVQFTGELIDACIKCYFFDCAKQYCFFFFLPKLDAYRNPTADYLRDQLKVATLRKDRDALENLINECETCAYPELSYDLQEARATLQELGGGYGG